MSVLPHLFRGRGDGLELKVDFLRGVLVWVLWHCDVLDLEMEQGKLPPSKVLLAYCVLFG